MGIRSAKLALALAVALVGPKVGGGQPPRGPKTLSSAHESAMQLYDGYLVVVEGSIGGLHGLQFLLDTGVTRSVIDRRVADQLSLPRGTASLINFDKAVRVESCQVSEISFGAEHAANWKVTVADLGYLGVRGFHIDGVIGWDLLGRKSFRLDFARRLVAFGSGEGLWGKGSKASRSALLRPNELFLMVETDVDGTPVWLIADTGAQGVTFYQERLTSIGARYTVRGDDIGQSVGGAIKARVADVRRLRLGAQDLNSTVHLVHAPLSGAPEGIAGYLGLAALGAKQVEFNFEKNELSWVN